MMRTTILVLLAACGSKGGGSDVTSIANTKTMGELSRDEKKTLCQDFKAFQKKVAPTDDEQRKMKCSFEAAMQSMQNPDAADLPAACKKTRDECVAKKEPVPQPEMDCNNDEVLAKMAECPELTIADMSECVKDMGSVMKTFAAQDLCAGLSRDQSAFTKIFDQMKSPKCEALETKCKPAREKAAQAAGDKFHADAMKKIEGFSQQMCACKTKECADGVDQAMTAWSQQVSSTAPDVKPDPEVAKKTADHMVKLTECMTKLQSAEPGSAGSAAPAAPTGSAAPVAPTGSAAPVAPAGSAAPAAKK